MSDLTPAELREEIAETRADLSQTVDQLAHKLDVKAQSKDLLQDNRFRLIAGSVVGIVLVVVIGRKVRS